MWSPWRRGAQEQATKYQNDNKEINIIYIKRTCFILYKNLCRAASAVLVYGCPVRRLSLAVEPPLQCWCMGAPFSPTGRGRRWYCGKSILLTLWGVLRWGFRVWRYVGNLSCMESQLRTPYARCDRVTHMAALKQAASHGSVLWTKIGNRVSNANRRSTNCSA